MTTRINESVVAKAAKIIVDTQEVKSHTSMSWEDAYKGASNWYNNTDLTSPYMIAACVLKYGIYYKVISFNDILQASKEFEGGEF